MVIGLVGGMMGAAVADFSDIETSRGNFFQTGSLDLTVSDYLGVEYQDPNVPAFVQLDDAWPCCTKDYYIDLHNAGEGTQFVPWAYLHVKNVECYGLPGKDNATKTEPELAAEQGLTPVGESKDGKPVYAALDPTKPAGTANPPLLGEYGENCELTKHVDLQIFWSAEQVLKAEQVTHWTQLDLKKYDTNGDNITKINEIVSKQIELGQIPSCNKLWLDLKWHLQDVDEDSLGFHLFDETNPIEVKFDHWVTNALQRDGMKFDMAFELLQNKVP
jgi:hypothetical protein